jgi:hypothetical protein
MVRGRNPRRLFNIKCVSLREKQSPNANSFDLGEPCQPVQAPAHVWQQSSTRNRLRGCTPPTATSTLCHISIAQRACLTLRRWRCKPVRSPQHDRSYCKLLYKTTIFGYGVSCHCGSLSEVRMSIWATYSDGDICLCISRSSGSQPIAPSFLSINIPPSCTNMARRGGGCSRRAEYYISKCKSEFFFSLHTWIANSHRPKCVAPASSPLPHHL